MKRDKQHLIKWIGNGFLILGAAVGAAALINTWQAAKTLPAGVCPYNSSRSWLYLSIVLILASLILSFFEGPHKPKK